MSKAPAGRDHSLDTLLELDGQVIVITADGHWWVKFLAKVVPVMPQKPHGLDYALSLFRPPNNARWVGYDNAHAVRRSAGPAGKAPVAWDHKHRLKVIRPYEYTNAGTLVADFWRDVDSVLAENGVLP